MLAIIPARGGSKGLPGKNIRLLNGKPLLAYTIEAALRAKHIDRVIISTDDNEIANVAVQYGAELPFMRPDFLATDTALAVDNYIYTIGRLEETEGSSIDAFVVLQPTSPLRLPEDIDGAVNLFNEKKADSVISYCKEAHPVYWHKKLDSEGRLLDLFEDKLANRQDFPVTYYPNGAVYVFRTDLIRKRQYYSDKTYAYIMPRIRSVDIDFVEDFDYACYLIKQRH